MFNSNGAMVAKDSGKGKMKMKEVAGEQSSHQNNNNNGNNRFNILRQQQFVSPNVEPLQQRLNTAGAGHLRLFGSTLKPFSFMSLLTAPDDELPDISHSYQIDQIITHHNDNLKHVLASMLNDCRRITEERAAKKLKVKDEELQAKSNQTAHLQQMLDVYKGESERLLDRVRFLERMTISLRANLEEARRAETEDEDDDEEEQDDSESSFEDPDRVKPVMLDCKACHRQMATVMIWPCRHVCVCKGCENAVTVCPVCPSPVTASLEVSIPLE